MCLFTYEAKSNFYLQPISKTDNAATYVIYYKTSVCFIIDRLSKNREEENEQH